MSDARRFDAFANLIARNFPRAQSIADIAGGKGYLQAALRQRGYSNVVTWDKCKATQRRTHRAIYRHRLFDWREAEPADLFVGMHPDGATDHILKAAAAQRVPAIICPCCALPSAVPAPHVVNYATWLHHLDLLARKLGFDVQYAGLPIRGRNTVIIARPT